MRRVLKTITGVVLLGGLALCMAVLTPTSGDAWADSGIGQRTFSDERVPQTQVKKRVIIRKKERSGEGRSKGQGQEADPAIGVSEEESGSERQDDMSEQGMEPPAEMPEAMDQEEQDSLYVTPQENEQVEEEEDASYNGREDEDEEGEEAFRRVERSSCKQVCELTGGSASCFQKCERSGFCGLDFVDCARDGSITVREEDIPTASD